MSHRSFNSHHGSALMLVIIFIGIITTIGLAVIYTASTIYTGVQRDIDSTRLSYNCLAGLERAHAYLLTCDDDYIVNWSAYPGEINPDGGPVVFQEASDDMTRGTYDVSLKPLEQSSFKGNNGVPMVRYYIVSTGTVGGLGKAMRIIVDVSTGPPRSFRSTGTWSTF